MKCKETKQLTKMINHKFQGVLRDAAGIVAPNGNCQSTLKLYDATTGGNLLWPEEYVRFRNYPNPFLSGAKSRFVADAAPRGAGNSETEIRFAIPQASHVVVKIFNLIGAEIRTLVDEQREAGYHRVHWDSRDKNGKAVASGIYLYQLQAGRFSQAKKMKLLR
jgi:hypothetical protein